VVLASGVGYAIFAQHTVSGVSGATGDVTLSTYINASFASGNREILANFTYKAYTS
jgi:hypothetical protein